MVLHIDYNRLSDIEFLIVVGVVEESKVVLVLQFEHNKIAEGLVEHMQHIVAQVVEEEEADYNTIVVVVIEVGKREGKGNG